jgi:hypothetical protein
MFNRPKNKTILSSHLKSRSRNADKPTQVWDQNCWGTGGSLVDSSPSTLQQFLPTAHPGVGGSNLPSSSNTFQRCGWKTIPAHPHLKRCGWGGCAHHCAQHTTTAAAENNYRLPRHHTLPAQRGSAVPGGGDCAQPL